MFFILVQTLEGLNIEIESLCIVEVIVISPIKKKNNDFK
jgi:hypothetical protein